MSSPNPADEGAGTSSDPVSPAGGEPADSGLANPAPADGTAAGTAATPDPWLQTPAWESSPAPWPQGPVAGEQRASDQSLGAQTPPPSSWGGSATEQARNTTPPPGNTTPPPGATTPPPGSWGQPQEDPRAQAGGVLPGYPQQTGYAQPGDPYQAGYPQPGYPQQPGYLQQAGYPQPGYPQAGYPQPFVGAQARNNPLAITALVCGIVQFVLGLFVVLNILGAIPAIICGAIALRQIRERRERGRGMAIAGLVLGILGVVYFILVIILIVVGLHIRSGSS